MSRNDIKLLDCTLRDGGYVNDWEWGFHRAYYIIRSLIKAGVDIVEVGFLRNVDRYNPDITVCNTIEELNKLLPDDRGNTMFSAMAMRSNYDIKKLTPYSGNGIEMIRVTAHDYDIADGMDFAREVKNKGYKLSINPINIMGYSDEQILWILKQVNEIHPYQFSIVDTFGSMKRRDLDRIVSLVDNNLDRDIRVGLHLHENMSLSCLLAQAFVDKHLQRPTVVDGSLMGIGRIPGNLPIELIADYLNEYIGSSYEIDNMLDAIQDYISPMKGDVKWGYTPAYFLSARFNIHRNYAEFYLAKGDLTNRDINHILSRVDKGKSTVFDAEYAERLYREYKDSRIDDTMARGELQKIIESKNILILAPGQSILEYKDIIDEYILDNHPVVIAVNFVPDNYKLDFVFFGNNKRFSNSTHISCKTIVTSNLLDADADYRIDYNSVSSAFKQGCNSMILLLKLLKDLGASNIAIAGADGYTKNGYNYYIKDMRSYIEPTNDFNLAVVEAIAKLDVSVEFITPSAYDK